MFICNVFLMPTIGKGYCNQFLFVFLSVHLFVLLTQKLEHQSTSNLVARYFMGYIQITPNLVKFE